MFEGYSAEEANHPSAVLHFANIASPSFVKTMTKHRNFPRPYAFRMLLPNEKVCFPRDDVAGVYCAFFSLGFRFPLDKDVETLLAYYKLPLCQYSPTAIRAMLAFLSLIRPAQVPFSLA